FAVAHLVDDEDEATGPRPGHAHVLKLVLRLIAVVGVSDQDSWHRLPRLSRDVQVARHPLSRPALVDHVLDLEAVALDGASHADVRLAGLRILAQRATQ